MMTSFDANRYIGTWHELASIPMYFEDKCDGAVAIYQLEEEILKITNLCTKEGEIVTSISGKATQTDVPGRFQVDFVPTADFPSPSRGSYWVYMTDYTSFSIVSDKDKRSLWILGRNKRYTPLQKQVYEVLCASLDLPGEELKWRFS